MIFRWLFTFFVLWWLWQVIRPWFITPPLPPDDLPPQPLQDPAAKPKIQPRSNPTDDDYIDFEEIK